ncbi:CHASE3 domain-containing protein [Actinoplanes sp. NPDC026619]|uniref:CHASE3 domain-containing protein n=1 Tax=Actinoplanes sp. NPDC026619 TaxID=3155798 RepID=UPI0033D2F681
MEHTYLVLCRIADVSVALKDAETGQRGFLITGEDSYLAPYTAAQTNVATAQQTLRTLTADNAAQQARLDELAPLIESKFAELKETIDLRAGSGGFAADRAGQLSQVSAQMEAEATEVAQQAAAASTTSEEVSTGVQSIAAGAEQMADRPDHPDRGRRTVRPGRDLNALVRGFRH